MSASNMLQLFDRDWVISPAGGLTGEAYMAQSPNETLFLKRNSSPFLAVLSAEGIVPKLLWTKRMENGDVITAQQWLKGRELKPNEMKSKNVAELLYKIHSSQPLLLMLSRIGKEPVTPQLLLNGLLEQLKPTWFVLNSTVTEAIGFLKQAVKDVDYPEKVVCHSDINHNNWLLGQEGNLYLVDWDQAIIADPALDLAMLLYWYIDVAEWEKWLLNYGTVLDDSLRLRMHWYMVTETLLLMFWHRDRGHEKEALIYENDLVRLNEQTEMIYFNTNG